MDSDNIYSDSRDRLLVDSGTKVTVPDMIVFERDGKVIGKLDAQLDFGDLAPELHQQTIQILGTLRRHIYQPSHLNYSVSFEKDSAQLSSSSSKPQPEAGDIMTEGFANNIHGKIVKFFRGLFS
jgi:hypothetical protein